MVKPLLVIAAGGTGGHMFPAQALAQEMLRRGWRVALASDERGLRYAGDYPDDVVRRELKAASFARGGVLARLGAPLRIWKGSSEALEWFRADPPAIAAGFGGYPSLPALMAAWRMKLPRLIHEQNGVLGKVNRLFAPRADVLALGVEPVRNLPAGVRTASIGNPIRDAARAQAGAPYPALDETSEIRLVIFGGSQGARIFREVAPPALAALPEPLRARLRLTQQVRAEDQEQMRAIYAHAGIEAELAAFFDDMPARIAASHLVICRAGASTIAELSAIGRPSVLVPLPSATFDHQTANAEALAESGAAMLLPEVELSHERLTRTLADLFAEPGRLTAMAETARGFGRPEAASALADLVVEMAGR